MIFLQSKGIRLGGVVCLVWCARMDHTNRNPRVEAHDVPPELHEMLMQRFTIVARSSICFMCGITSDDAVKQRVARGDTVITDRYIPGCSGTFRIDCRYDTSFRRMIPSICIAHDSILISANARARKSVLSMASYILADMAIPDVASCPPDACESYLFQSHNMIVAVFIRPTADSELPIYIDISRGHTDIHMVSSGKYHTGVLLRDIYAFLNLKASTKALGSALNMKCNTPSENL